jgi:hypothetical protein
MTEREWLTCDGPEARLRWRKLKGSARKKRLFAAACGRRVAHLLPAQKCQEALEVAEQFADRILDQARLKAVIKANEADAQAGGYTLFVFFLPHEVVRLSEYHAALNTAFFAAGLVRDVDAEQKSQAELFREIFGNPFRPVTLDPSWLMPTSAPTTATPTSSSTATRPGGCDGWGCGGEHWWGLR